MATLELERHQDDDSSAAGFEVPKQLDNLKPGFLNVVDNGITHQIPVNVQDSEAGDIIFVLLPESPQPFVYESDQIPPYTGIVTEVGDQSVGRTDKSKAAIRVQKYRDKTKKEREERQERITSLQAKLINSRIEESFIKGKVSMMKTLLKAALSSRMH